MKRREFLRNSLGMGSGVLALTCQATLTAANGNTAVEKLTVTEKNILGPYFRSGAPCRAKISPPMAKGRVLLISGRVWSIKTKKPINGALLDIWQADHEGHYDNDGSSRLDEKEFLYRSQLISREDGFYEFESILPSRYKIAKNTWRPRHIHYRIKAPGHKELITQLYFKDDPHNKNDKFIHPSLIIPLKDEKGENGTYQSGTFDIVLDGL